MTDILERMEAFDPDGFGSSDSGPGSLRSETLGAETLTAGTSEPEPSGPEPFDPATLASAERAADEAGLVSRVSAAGFQVSQATEGLEQVAGLLRAAKKLAKDADAQRREVREALEHLETQRDDLTAMLAAARAET